MSAPATPAPPISPAPVAAVRPVAAAVPSVETTEPLPGADQSATPHENSFYPVAGTPQDGIPISVQPLDSTAPGTPLPEFSVIPSVTPVPPPEEKPNEPEEEPPAPTWAHGLFGCFDMDMKLLGLTMCCPCITFGANAELLGEDWMLYCLFCILPGPMCYFGPYIRHKIRTTFEIEGTDNEDVLAYLLCPCLSIIQETQQLKSAGMKPGGDAMNRG